MSRKKCHEMILIVPGLAVPDYMGFLLELCEPIGYTKKAIESGHLLRIDHHPPYIQVKCNNPDLVIREARKRGLRVYRAKNHVTISDGIYKVRIY